MRRPRISQIRPWLPWAWRIGGPLAAVVAIQFELASVGLVILGWSIFFDIRWWYQRRRRA
jgi:hypothetical protein